MLHLTLLVTRRRALYGAIDAAFISITGQCAAPTFLPLFKCDSLMSFRDRSDAWSVPRCDECIDATFEESPILASPPTAQAQSTPQVFKGWVKRQRTMTLNRTALDVMSRPRTGIPTDITLNLFDGGPRTLDLDQPRGYPKQMKVWRGQLRGEPGSDVTLVAQGTTLVGAILSGQYLYKIEAADGQFHRLLEIDESTLLRITIPSSSPTIPLQPLPQKARHNRLKPLLPLPVILSSICWSSTRRRQKHRKAARLRWKR